MGEHHNWDLDLIDGEAAESEFLHILLRPRFEIKRDRRCWRDRATGNICIETHQGQPRRHSGLSTTEADWWAIEYDDDAWIVMSTHRLKTIVREVKGDKPLVSFGDNHNYGVLVPVERLVGPIKASNSHIKEAV
jgi:hypothetical protein